MFSAFNKIKRAKKTICRHIQLHLMKQEKGERWILRTLPHIQ